MTKNARKGNSEESNELPISILKAVLSKALVVFIEHAPKDQIIVIELSTNTGRSFYLKTTPKISTEEVQLKTTKKFFKM